MKTSRNIGFGARAVGLGLILASVGSAGANTRYVSINGAHVPPFNNGWGGAATNIQDAINAAAAGDTVLVSNGVYYLDSTITLSSSVKLVGFGGCDETIIDAQYPDQSIRAITLSSGGSAAAPTVLDGFTIRNGRRIGSGGGVHMDGVHMHLLNSRIENNRAGGAYDSSGGGVYAATTVEKCNLVISNCVVVGNIASPATGTTTAGGGGIYVSGTYSGDWSVGLPVNPLIVDCIITNNTSGNMGGGVMLFRGGTVDGCTIVNNTAGNNGGGGVSIYTANSDRAQRGFVLNSTIANNSGPVAGGIRLFNNLVPQKPSIVSNCVIRGNTATSANSQGGGIHAGYVEVVDCDIIGNTAGNGNGTAAAGGILMRDRTTVIRCNIVSNYAWGVSTMAADVGGGGVYMNTTSTNAPATLRNSLVAANQMNPHHGGGVFMNGPGNRVESCTIVRNFAQGTGKRGGGLYYNNSTGTVVNTVIALNSAATGTDIYNSPANYAGFSHNLCADISGGTSNLTSAPTFVAAGSGFGTTSVLGDYTQKRPSPGINQGLYQDWMNGARDLVGNPRIVSDIVDMGAYETPPPSGTILSIR